MRAIGRFGPRHQRAAFGRQKKLAPKQIHRKRVGRTPAGFGELESGAISHETAAQSRKHAEHWILSQRQRPRDVGEGGVSAEQFVAAQPRQCHRESSLARRLANKIGVEPVNRGLVNRGQRAGYLAEHVGAGQPDILMFDGETRCGRG